MISIKRQLFLGILLNLAVCIGLVAQAKSLTTHLYFFKMTPFPNAHFIKGQMFVSESEIHFVPTKLKTIIKEITINCTEIQAIKPVNPLLIFPNRFKIIMTDGICYEFYGYRRKKRLANLCK
jgi:hypothetical protein